MYHNIKTKLQQISARDRRENVDERTGLPVNRDGQILPAEIVPGEAEMFAHLTQELEALSPRTKAALEQESSESEKNAGIAAAREEDAGREEFDSGAGGGIILDPTQLRAGRTMEVTASGRRRVVVPVEAEDFQFDDDSDDSEYVPDEEELDSSGDQEEEDVGPAAKRQKLDSSQ